MRLSFILILGASFGILAWGQSSGIDDPLHGCIVGTSCVDNGTVTPTTTNPLPNFTFTVSPGPNTGDLLVEILVPNNAANANSLNFSISGTSGGSGDTTNVASANSTLEGLWTSGGLDTDLGLTLANGSPKNNITAWLPYTQGKNCGSSQNQACDSSATGYYVYQVDLGNNELQGPSDPTKPILTLSGSALPTASLLVGFLGQSGNTYISTANSGAIFEGGSPSPTVPEPASVLLLGTLAVVSVTALKKRTSKQG